MASNIAIDPDSGRPYILEGANDATLVVIAVWPPVSLALGMVVGWGHPHARCMGLIRPRSSPCA